LPIISHPHTGEIRAVVALSWLRPSPAGGALPAYRATLPKASGLPDSQSQGHGHGLIRETDHVDLFDGEHYEPDDVLAHPRHLAMQKTLTNLIQQLRDCDTNESGIAFQHDLLREVLAVQEDRAGYKRAAVRVRGGKAVQVGAPEPQSGRDGNLPETWQFEQYVCERLDRQLRSVGDALAWRVFQFHRPFILALCRNDPPGYMHGKAGLVREQEEIHREWKENGNFSLLHDLTQCLRIGDITVFNDLASPETREVKTNPNKMRRAQVERINTARAAALHRGPLTQDNSAEFLFELDLPLRTHLDLLREAMNEAADAGLAEPPRV